MGVAVCWVVVVCATVETRCLKTVMHPTPSVPLTHSSGRNLLDGYRQPVLVTDFGIAFLQQALAALLHAVCASHGLVDERWRSRFSTQLAGMTSV